VGFVHKEVRRLAGKAIHRHGMTRHGDHILVGVSGGKDSLSLLWLLKERLRRIPIRYRITAAHVDPGFGANSADLLKDFFQEQGIAHHIVRTDIGPRAHSAENSENPCFLCARLRRKRLFELAEELDCNRIALGHHKDDLIETFFLNVFYSASISTMLPVQPLFNGRLTLIRPLYLIEEDLLARYARTMDWPAVRLGCPSAGHTKRQEIKTMLRGFYRTNRKIKGNIFHALQHVKTDYLPLAHKSGHEEASGGRGPAEGEGA
jgi:tRNA 2-thiocytidine biosynthesis protein TtcA